jgi:hypothetical protein
LRYTCLVSVLLFATAWKVQAAESDAVELLQSRRYPELEHTFQSIQDSFKRGAIDDEALLAAFRSFYDVKPPRLTARYDEWIAQFPKSYVARLARGIHYKYRANEAQDGRFPRELGDARFDELRRAQKLAAADFEQSLALDDRPLLSYVHAMDVSSDMSWRWPEGRLFDKANEIAPTNFIARRKHLLRMRWRWTGGTVTQMQEFVQECRELRFTERQMRELNNIVNEEQAWLALHRESDYARAELLYRELLDEEPDNMEVAAALTWLLTKRKECGEVISLATRVLQQQPDNSKTIGNRAFCYFHTGQDQLGIIDYRRAAELGDSWAQKHLARYYWQGNLVPKDRDRALQLLRASAVQGDTGAIREYERVTGEKLPERRDRRAWGTVIKLGLGALAVIALVRGLVLRFHRPPEAGQLRYPASTMINGVICLLFFSSTALVSSIYGNHTATIWTTLLFLGFATMGLRLMTRYLFGKHEFTADGILYRPMIAQRLYLFWRDVTSVHYARMMRSFVLNGESNRAVRVSDQLLGLPGFARAVLDHVPPSAIDESSRMVLSAIAEYVPDEEEKDSYDHAGTSGS